MKKNRKKPRGGGGSPAPGTRLPASCPRPARACSGRAQSTCRRPPCRCCPCAWLRPAAAAARRAAPAPVLAAARRPPPTPGRAVAVGLSPAVCAWPRAWRQLAGLPWRTLVPAGAGPAAAPGGSPASTSAGEGAEGPARALRDGADGEREP